MSRYQVQFKVDGTVVGPQITATPYNYSLVTSLTNATHTLTAVASDTSRQHNDERCSKLYRKQHV